jgi:hypothetical protein
MKRASAASDDLEAELDHRIGMRLARGLLPRRRRRSSVHQAASAEPAFRSACTHWWSRGIGSSQVFVRMITPSRNKVRVYL